MLTKASCIWDEKSAVRLQHPQSLLRRARQLVLQEGAGFYGDTVDVNNTRRPH